MLIQEGVAVLVIPSISPILVTELIATSGLFDNAAFTICVDSALNVCAFFAEGQTGWHLVRHILS
jgi:hypothetical protein